MVNALAGRFSLNPITVSAEPRPNFFAGILWDTFNDDYVLDGVCENLMFLWRENSGGFHAEAVVLNRRYDFELLVRPTAHCRVVTCADVRKRDFAPAMESVLLDTDHRGLDCFAIVSRAIPNAASIEVSRASAM
jgi:hypothetical protein